MNNKLFRRFRQLENELHGLEHRGFQDWYEGAAEESERQAERVRRQIARFKPNKSDISEALDELNLRRESLVNDLAQVDTAIIELGEQT